MNAPITVTASGLRAAAQVRIVIDYENNAARWWGAAFKAREGCPESCRPLIAGSAPMPEGITLWRAHHKVKLSRDVKQLAEHVAAIRPNDALYHP